MWLLESWKMNIAPDPTVAGAYVITVETTMRAGTKLQTVMSQTTYVPGSGSNCPGPGRLRQRSVGRWVYLCRISPRTVPGGEPTG